MAKPMEHKKEAMYTLKQAEGLFKAGDLRGAMRLAYKARCLSPFFPGLLNLQLAYCIHLYAKERKLPSGDTDWYAVLDVQPSSDFEVIKKRYMAVRRLTHPDNCKSAAAEGALKLVEEAWSYITSSPPDSTTNPESQNMTSHSRPQLPLTCPGDAKLKPATWNSNGQLVCPHCQAEFGFKIIVDNPVSCKCQSCHGFAMITPKDKFTDSSSCRQPENSSPLQHKRTSPPLQLGTAQATSSQSRIPNFLLCPFCGTQNSYTVIDGLCHVTCERCGVPSSIRKDGDQTGGASPSCSQTCVAMCRKCRTSYDGEIPNNRRILRRCKLCGSWASIKLEIEQITTPVVPGSGERPET